jgi:hypothetical protein
VGVLFSLETISFVEQKLFSIMKPIYLCYLLVAVLHEKEPQLGATEQIIWVSLLTKKFLKLTKYLLLR